MEEIAQNVQLLPEKTLQDIAKGPLVKFTQSCGDFDKVNRVWQSLILTASTASLSYQHTAAACNAASAFIEAAATAQIPSTKQLALAADTWLAIFDIIVSRYEDAKPKPLKQLLGTLTTVLAKYHKGQRRAFVQEAVFNAILPSIMLGEPRSRLKGSLVCLENFIRKSAIVPSELITLVQVWLTHHRERWHAAFEKDRQALSCGTFDFNLASDKPSKTFSAKIFTLGLLTQTNNHDMSGTAGGILAALIKQMKSEPPAEDVSTVWVAPARYMLLQNMENLERLSSTILLPLFTADPAGFVAFVKSLPLETLLAGDMANAAKSEYMLLFVALQMGKKANIVHEDYDFSKPVETKGVSSEKLVLKSEVIGAFLLHQEPSIRIAALSMLVTAFSTVKPLTTAATSAILRALPSMHANSDSYTRGEIMSLTRKFIIRLKYGVIRIEELAASGSASRKQQVGSIKDDTETKKFLGAYIGFLQSDLVVTASYPRHISALKALKLLLLSGLDPRADVLPPKSEVETRWHLKMDILEPHLLRLLVDLLLDPFEEVRQTSLSIISLFPQATLLHGLIDAEQQSTNGVRLTDALARAERLASNTSRADHADTVARLYHIFFCAASQSSGARAEWWATKSSVVNTILLKLEERLSSSGGLFSSSLRDAPLHGYMSGLRYIVLTPNFHSLVSNGPSSPGWRSIHDRIVSICDKVWQEVKPILCIDSPEGHSDEPLEDLSVGPKDVLSYSWRALRESSLLLHATIFNITYGPSNDGLLRADFQTIGKATFTQLAELRHRGAFSTVSQTFTTCCQRCSSSEDCTIQELPKAWYQEAKTTIFESASKLTRRSAGLPALVTGILASDPGTLFFKQALNELHDISRLPVEYNKDQQYLELPQVHAMNCLKDIFTNTKLGQYTERSIMPALTLSAERLGSPIWALRNSGLMLFRALLFRMCRLVPGTGSGFGGSSGAEPGSKISFPKYPGLMELLSKLLSSTAGIATEGTDIVTERIFPALELIGEKIPIFNDNSDVLLCDLVREHFKSPVWGIREHAARVYASLLTRSNFLRDVEQLLEHLQGSPTENYTHGTALCIRYSLRRFATTTDISRASHLEYFKATLREVLAALFPIARSPYTATVLVEILNDILERSFKAGTEHQVASFIKDIRKEHDLDGILAYVFDATQVGWNCASRTRASGLLRRAIAWCVTLEMLALQNWGDIPTFYRRISRFDADAATWIAEQLEEIGENEKYRKPLVDMYSSVILSDQPVIVKTMAVSNLASILENLLSLQDAHVSGLELPLDELTMSFRPETNIQVWNRHATNVALRLQGCLLAARVSIRQPQPFTLFSSDIQSWIIKLRSAVGEETEFTTRHAAVASLRSFARGLHPSGHPPMVDAAWLDIYLILYDMLNDDDDELRDIAANTASWVLSYSSVSPNTAIALDPLNASELLATFIIDHYSDSPQLTQRVIRYLTGQELRISGSDEDISLVSVSHLFTEYNQESTVLFVEEKQNLFIDEVREIDIWTRALVHFKKDAYSEDLVQQTSDWVSAGLEYLSNRLAQDAGRDGLLGWMSKPECFTLAARLINIGIALTFPGFAASDLLSIDQQALLRRLELVLDAGKSSAIHDELLSRIQKGLDFGVNKDNKV